MNTDTRNVQDKYRGWETDLIAKDLIDTASGFAALFVNVAGDFNKSSGVRNVNWFNGSCAVMAGDKKWDRRGAVGTHNYTPVEHIEIEDLPGYLNVCRNAGFRIVAAEIDDRAVSLVSYWWPEDVIVIFGEESAGLSKEILDLCDDIVYIPGRGSVRSLNVATTSGIFLYDYSIKRSLIR